MNNATILLIVFLQLAFTFIVKGQIAVKELGFGICKTKTIKVDNLNMSPSGQHLSGEKKLNIINQTDTIIIADGVQFGIEYIITDPKTEVLPIKTVWTYPDGLKDKHGQPLKKTEYMVSKKTNEYTYSNYKLGPRPEMVTGDWILELYYNDRQILKKIFHLK